MPRPHNSDSAQTRHRILSSAVQRFAKQGAAGASMRDIARGAHVSLALVHHYFGTKDQLYVACVDSMYDRLGKLRSDLEQALKQGGAWNDLVDRAVRVGYRFARSEQVAVRLLMRAIAETGQLEAERMKTVQEPFLDTTSALLGAALDREPRSLRLPLQSVVALVARYAMSSPRELGVVAGTGKDVDAALEIVEDHLVDVARALLSTGKRP